MRDVPQASLEAAAALLRSAGWSVLPPPPEKKPEPDVGQVWVTPMQNIGARRITAIGPHPTRPKEARGIHFERLGPDGEVIGIGFLPRDSWRSWVRGTGARPA